MSGEADGLDDLSIAVAHWHIRSWGGAEYLVTHLADALGCDRVYTLGEPSPEGPNPYGTIRFEDVTPLLAYPGIRRVQRRAGRLFEYAQWEDVDWREFGDPDILVTSGATTRAVITPDDTLHVNYCHSPPRWFYDLYHDRKSSLRGVLARPLIRYLRTRDHAVDPRVDQYFVNSPIIKRRLWKYYKRDGDVLYPPVDLDKYRNDGDGGFYLHLGRLDEEKGVPAVVEAFSTIDRRLVMIGQRGDVDDPVIRAIERTGNIEWRGFVPEEEKIDLLARCRGVLYNARNEDFGIVPIEANASGKPVLARDEGFPGIFVDEGTNGYCHDGSPAGIRSTIDRLEADGVTAPSNRTDRFSRERFETDLRQGLVTQYRAFAATDTPDR